MVLDAVSNFVRGNTDAEVGTEDTTVSVADASIFPDPSTDGEFNVVIWDANNFPRPDQDGDVEIMRVTARDTDTNELTVTRGQEMTSAAAHPEGSAIHLSPTAKMFSDIESTFEDFWDAGTQELTADVNNTNTTTTALEAGSLNTENLDITGAGTIYQSGSILSAFPLGLIEEPSATTSDTYTGVAKGTGTVPGEIPDSATLVGRFAARFNANVDGETADIKPQVTQFDPLTSQELDELEISVTGGSFETVDTGWVEITTSGIDGSEPIAFRELRARVTGDGQLIISPASAAPAVVFGWRIN